MKQDLIINCFKKELERNRYEAYPVQFLLDLYNEAISSGAKFINFEIECGEGYCEEFILTGYFTRFETDEEEKQREEDALLRAAEQRKKKDHEEMLLYQRLKRKFDK